MPEETPQLPVSEQEVQIEAPSLLEKIQAQKKKILIGVGVFFGVLAIVGTIFGAYYLGRRQDVQETIKSPTPTPAKTLQEETGIYKGMSSYDYECKFTLQYPSNCKIVSRGQGWQGQAKEPVAPYGLILCEGEDCRFKLDPFASGFNSGLEMQEFETSQIEFGKITWEKRFWENLGLSSYFPSQPGTNINEGLECTFVFTIVYEKYSEQGEKLAEQILSTFKFLEEGAEGEKVYCEEPRPEVCTMECLVNPPYICGSDGKSYCTECQACAKPNVEWYITQDQLCGSP